MTKFSANSVASAETWIRQSGTDLHKVVWRDAEQMDEFLSTSGRDRCHLIVAAMNLKLIPLVVLLCHDHQLDDAMLLQLAKAIQDEWSHFDGPDRRLVGLLADQLGDSAPPQKAEAILRSVLKMPQPYDKKAAQRTLSIIRRMVTKSILPIERDEAWADRALKDIKQMSPDERNAWGALLGFCMEATAARPSAKWRATAVRHIGAVGQRCFTEHVTCWLRLVERGRPRVLKRRANYYDAEQTLLMTEANESVLKGLVWCAGFVEDASLVEPLASVAVFAYEKVPKYGNRSKPVGNACIYSLGQMPAQPAKAALHDIRQKIAFRSAHTAIDKSLDAIDKHR